MGEWDQEGETIPQQRPLPRALARGLRLEVTRGPDQGKSAESTERLLLVGRGPEAHLSLTDPAASRFHCELDATPNGARLRDLRSRNGTHYAGARVTEIELCLPAAFEVGANRIEVRGSSSAAREPLGPERFGELVGCSELSRTLFAQLARLARTELTICLEGATGTGKELAARALHAASPVARGPFLVLDCTAIPASLAESALFGHERGAFTGAASAQLGAFEAASGGTIFLDEVGDLPVELQPKLLRVLERREVVRVGSTPPRPARVRVLTATWRDLRAMVNNGRFREDLYYRIAHARVALPSLDERPEDIPLLAGHFLSRLPADTPGARRLAPEALRELERRSYPGNVRELRALLERLSALAETDTITLEDLAAERLLARPRGVQSSPPKALEVPSVPPPGAALPDFKEARRGVVEDFERAYLQRLMERSEYNLSRAARTAGLERHSLRELLKRHGLRDAE